MPILGLALMAVSAAQPNIPTIKIADGVELPMAGLGTWQYNSSRAGAAVLNALSLGYTHIDTALGYENQDGIGAALKASGRPRTSYFITSKIPGGLNFSAATAAISLSLTQLAVDYVDLMLVHFPATWGGSGGSQMRVETWKALEAAHKAGKLKAIGVSHYCKRHVEDILKINTVPVAVNQVQFHVGMGSPTTSGPNATDDMMFDRSKGITYESFSPLCGPCGTTELIDGDLVTSIGKKHGKSGAQVSLRWQVQLGIPVIPKTDNVDFLKENIDLFDWELSDDDMAKLTAATSPAVAGNGQGSSATSGDCDVL